MKRNSLNLKEKISKEIANSISDKVLINSEKKEIKVMLKELAPDKRLSAVLRSEIFDLAHSKISDQNFPAVVQWLEEMNKVLLAAQKEEGINERVYFSPGEDCLNAILHQIKSAKQLIRICLFTISDDRISEQLISRHRNGAHVKIITDNDKINDRGSDIEKLFKAGISIKVDRTDNHMHHKFALFDKSSTITGSYNWTRSAERYNHENIIISDSADLHREFDREYTKLWNELIFYDEI